MQVALAHLGERMFRPLIDAGVWTREADNSAGQTEVHYSRPTLCGIWRYCGMYSNMLAVW